MLRIAFAAAALLAATPAFAQPGPPPGEHMRLFLSPSGEPFRGQDGLADWFTAADADKNGALTLTEFRDDAMRFFKVLDADGDGQVDGPENSAYETRIAPEITRADMGGPPGKRPIVRKVDKREPRVGAARFTDQRGPAGARRRRRPQPAGQQRRVGQGRAAALRAARHRS